MASENEEIPQEEQNQPEGRRDALKKILVGGGAVLGAQFLPTEWKKPVINSIVVPAHAQTSPTGTTTTATIHHGKRGPFVLAGGTSMLRAGP